MNGLDWIEPAWPAPSNIRAASTTRQGGVSEGPYASLNLGAHVGDAAESVRENRSRLSAALDLPSDPVWLEQVHGCRTIAAGSATDRQADAACTHDRGIVCAVMTADCLPILLCTRDGSSVAAIHAGWKGLLGGVVQTAVHTMDRPGIMAWMGPAIGPGAFEVGPDVHEAFTRQTSEFATAFRQTGEAVWLADIYQLGRLMLERAGVDDIHGGDHCTFSESTRFFSYRRDRTTGRMASLIWRE